MATTPGRLSFGKSRTVWLAKDMKSESPGCPPGKDWCDVLDTYEERAGVMEFDLEQFRPKAEALARREAINE